MWFKNLQAYRLPAPWNITADQLAAYLDPQKFVPCTSLEMVSQGWISPRENGELVYSSNKQLIIKLGTEKKLLPTSVINQVTKARAAEIEDQQGFAPGRKQMRELKEDVTDELLPRAFTVASCTWAWIDPVNGWLLIDAASTGKAEEVLKLLIKAIDKFPLDTLRTKFSPVAAMTDWLLSDEAPVNFTVDQDTELRSTGEGKATVRYIRHTLEADAMRANIEAGKQCTRLAMTWADKVSFVLTEGLAIKRITPLDVLKENADGSSKNDDERFASDMLLMTGELNQMLTALVEALGGEGAPEKGQLDIKDIPHLSDSSALTDEELYLKAVGVVMAVNRASVSLVQRHLHLGYNRAARLLEEMESQGVVSAIDATGSRQVIKQINQGEPA